MSASEEIATTTAVKMQTRSEPRSALRVIDSHYAEPAPGLRVLRPFPGPELDYASPFLMLDHFGHERIRPGDEGGLNPHPHRGFETVTFLFQGAMEHHDSSGGHGHLRAGGVQWMTAGSGIVHAEYRGREFVKQGGTLEGVQLWVNLPRKFKMEAPHYQDLPAERIPVARFEGGEARVVAGELFGVAGPAQTYTPMIVAHLKLAGGAPAEFAVPAGFNSFVYAIRGSGRSSSVRFTGNQLVEFRADGGSMQVTAEEPLDLLFLAGEPIDEPVVSWGPFVMNTREEIIHARDDYLAGRMGRLDERA